MPQSQNINNVQLSGQQTFTFASSTQAWAVATVTIDRTIANGLNTLPAGSTLGVAVQYSRDGTSWLDVGGSTIQGGLIIAKGVTLASDSVGIGIGELFPTGTAFRINTDASTPVRISGTVVYS